MSAVYIRTRLIKRHILCGNSLQLVTHKPHIINQKTIGIVARGPDNDTRIDIRRVKPRVFQIRQRHFETVPHTLCGRPKRIIARSTGVKTV